MRTADEQMEWEAGEESAVPTCAACGTECLDGQCDYCENCIGFGCPCSTCETWQHEQEASYREDESAVGDAAEDAAATAYTRGIRSRWVSQS